MASITSGEMADCDWRRSTFSGRPLFSRNGPLRENKRMHLNQNGKLTDENLKIII